MEIPQNMIKSTSVWIAVADPHALTCRAAERRRTHPQYPSGVNLVSLTCPPIPSTGSFQFLTGAHDAELLSSLRITETREEASVRLEAVWMIVQHERSELNLRFRPQ